jgi:protein-S-isoprenylcysteine O-methyltransferase Ste14
MNMDKEMIFRSIMVLAVIAMMAIRVTYQSKILRDKREVKIREGSLSLIAGGIAALTNFVFGIEYIFFPGSFKFAYIINYPDWLRWMGVFLLAAGILLLGLAHHHLGKNFNSLIVQKEGQVLVETGPYRWLRHPIYTAFLMNYLSGGLLASNIVLTVVPVTMYAILVAIRLGQEEKVLEDLFGQKYIEYEGRTGRLLPRLKKKARG